MRPVARSSSPPGGSPLPVSPAAIPSTSLAQAGPSGTHSPGAFPPFQGSQSEGYGEVEESEEEEPIEAPPPSFLDALTAVYTWLPPEKCPTFPDPPPRVHALYESDSVASPSSSRSFLSLPTVGLLTKEIEGSFGNDLATSGTRVPKSWSNALGTRFYTPHNTAWPLKPPPLDKDASAIGVSSVPVPGPHFVRAWESADSKLRQIVAMASHIDLMLGGAREAIDQDDSASLDMVLQSAAQASKHILSTSLAASTDILLSRRDASLAGSSVLQGPARELLRTAPLSSETLFGGVCERASKEDSSIRERILLTRNLTGSAQGGSRKRSFGAAGRGIPQGKRQKKRFSSASAWGRPPVAAPVALPWVPPVPPPVPRPSRGRGSY